MVVADATILGGIINQTVVLLARNVDVGLIRLIAFRGGRLYFCEDGKHDPQTEGC
jgi:hypothetical protein